MSALFGAYLVGALVGLLVAGVGAVALVLHLLDQLDEGTTLPARRPADEPTTRMAPVVGQIVDMPRRREWLA